MSPSNYFRWKKNQNIPTSIITITLYYNFSWEKAVISNTNGQVGIKAPFNELIKMQ